MIFFIAYNHIATLSHSDAFKSPKFTRIGTRCAEMSHIGTIRPKYLHSAVTRVRNQYKSLNIRHYTSRMLKLPLLFPFTAEIVKQIAIRI